MNLLLALLSASCFVTCNLLVKVSLGSGRQGLLYLVFPTACLAFWLFRKACGANGLAISEGLVGSVITIITIAIGILIFRETLTLKQWTGLGLVAAGMLLLI